MIHTPRSVDNSPRRFVYANPALTPHVPAVSRKVAGGGDEWLDRLCARAAAMQSSGCGVGGLGCQPLTLGIPQGSASGVVATVASATFTLVVPVAFTPNRLILSGQACNMNVTNLNAALGGPMLFGSSTSPIPGSMFAADIERHVQLQSYTVTAGQSIFVSVYNPTAGSLVFTGAIEGATA